MQSTAPYVAGEPIVELKSTKEDSYGKKMEPLPLALKLDAASAKHGTTFYLVDKTGKVSLCVDGSGNPVSDMSGLPGWDSVNETVTLPDDVIGYFKVATAWDGLNYGSDDPAPRIVVTLAGRNEFYPAEFGVDKGNVVSAAYSGRIMVDATAVETITKNGNPRTLTNLYFQELCYNPNGPVDNNNQYGVVDDSMISVVGLARSAQTNALGSVSYLLNWNGVNYFKVNTGMLDGDPPFKTAVIGAGYEVGQSEYSPYCLRVTSTKDANGVVTISGMRLVQNRADYSTIDGVVYPDPPNYVEIQDTSMLQWIYVDAEGLKGVNLPTHNAKQPVVIRNAGDGSAFSGLYSTDTFELAKEVSAFHVNGKKCSFKDGTITVDGKTILIPAGEGETPVVCLDGSVVQGTFRLNGGLTKLTASAVPRDTEDTVSREVIYSGSGAGVKVAVKMNGYRTGGEIDAVMDVHEGETVVMNNYKGSLKTLNEKTTITKENGVIKKTFHSPYLPFDIEMTSATATATTDLLSWRTFEVATAFDFGATKKGALGLFEADESGRLTIEAQPEGNHLAPVGANGRKNYVSVLASKASGTYTIKSLEIMVFNDKNDPDENWREWEQDNLTHYYNTKDDLFVSVAAPKDGNLALGKGAIVFGDERPARDENGYTLYDENGKKILLNDFPPHITVTNAQAGRNYTGFTAKDTVTGTLTRANDCVTVGGRKFYAGGNSDTVEIRGDGKAMNGVFRLDAGFETVGVDPYSHHVFTKKITGTAKDAVLVIEDGDFTGLTGLKAGQSVTFNYTEFGDDGKTVYRSGTLTYSAAAGSDANHLIITRKLKMNDWVVADTLTAELAKDANLADDNLYAAPHRFDWTMSTNDGGVGYFLVGNNLTEEKNLGTVEIGPTSTVFSEADSCYLQMELNGDGSVSRFSLFKYDEEKYNEEGIFDYESVSLSEIRGGTLNITAPATIPLYLDRDEAGLPNTVNVNIMGATAYSEIRNLRAGDSLKTAALAAGEWVTVVTKVMKDYDTYEEIWTEYKAADTCVLKMDFERDGDNVVAELSEGALEFTGDTTVRTKGGSYAVIANGDTVRVKVINGEVAAVSGLENGSVTVTGTNTNEAKYTAEGVTLTIKKAEETIETAALKKGQTVRLAGTDTVFTVGANGAMKFLADTTTSLRVDEGTLELTKDGSFTSTGEGLVTYDAAGDGAESHVFVTLRNGKVVSITGLKKDDSMTVGETTYTAVSDTIVDKGGVKAYLTTAGGDVVGAKYLTADADITNALEGQFSWGGVSGRSTGYFEVKSNSAKIAEQAGKSVVGAKKGTEPIFVVANTAPFGARQSLTIGAIRAKNGDGTQTVIQEIGAELLNGASLTVAAPTAALDFNKDTGRYKIALNKVAKNSVISGLDAGDTVATAVLESGSSVSINGQNYRAGAKGAMTFRGEGTDGAGLVSGTIVLSKGNATAYISDSKGGVTTVTAAGLSGVNYYGDRDDVTVTVRNGVVTGVTGLMTGGATLTIVPAGGKTVTYDVLSVYPSWNKARLYDTIIARSEEGTGTTFASFRNNMNICAASPTANGYKQTSEKMNSTNTAELWTKDGAKTAFVLWEYPAPTLTQKADENFAARTAERGRWYLAATVNTAKGVTTIKKLEMAQINAVGELKPVSGKIPDEEVVIDGTINESAATYEKKYAKLNYAISAATPVTVVNAGLGSVFSGMKSTDKITSAATGEAGYDLSKGTITIYHHEGGVQTLRTVTYRPGATGDSANIVTDTHGAITKISGLDKAGESVTIVGNGTTTVYAVSADGKLTKTVIAQNGAKKIYAEDDGGAADALTGVKLAATPTIREIVSEFDWTTARNRTGYFAVSGTGATAKTTKTAIGGGDTKKYIAVSVSADGAVSDISQKVFDGSETAADGMKDAAEKFSGTIHITAPKTALSLSRASLNGETIDTTKAKLAVSGAAAGSVIGELANGDTVKTAALKVNQRVAVQSHSFKAGAKGALEFQMQESTLTLTSGTVSLSNGEYVYVGAAKIEALRNKITVKASGTGYTIGGVEIGETFSVTENGKTKTYYRSNSALFCESDGKYTVYAIGAKTAITGANLNNGNLWKETDTAFTTDTVNDVKIKTPKHEYYGAVTVDLALLDKRIAADNKAAGAVLHRWYNYDVDYRVATSTTYKNTESAFVLARFEERLNVREGEAQLQLNVGSIPDASLKYYTARNLTDDNYNVGQTLKVTNGWTVIGSGADDTIKGAAKGSDTLSGWKGDDLLVGGGANDTFFFDFTKTDNDVVKNYASGKDKIVVGTDTIAFDENGVKTGAFAAGGALSLDRIALVETPLAGNKKSADVLLHDGSYDGCGANNSVLLVGMGNGKAVTINGKDYYFGSAVETKGKTKGMTFTYAEGAYYLGKAGTTTANTLSVGTNNKKAAAKVLGDAVEIDLSDTDHYRNIQVVDASKSGNALVLTAGDDGSTLKGGTYRSILKAGSGQDSLVGGAKGNDVFWFDTIEKDDVVSGYTSGKDSVYLGGNQPLADSLTIAASGNDVVIKNGDIGSVTLQKAVNAAKAVTILADEDGVKALNYYVGADKAKAKNGFTAIIGTDTVTDKENITAFTSYYIGSANITATDTLTVKTAKGAEARVMKATFSLQNDKHLSAIDAIDASGISAASGSQITYEGAASGSFKLIGVKSANVKETFNLANLAAGAKAEKATITNFSVDDVIELGAGITLENGKTVKGSYVCDLKVDGALYGTLTISGVAEKNISYDAGKHIVKYKA